MRWEPQPNQGGQDVLWLKGGPIAEVVVIAVGQAAEPFNPAIEGGMVEDYYDYP